MFVKWPGGKASLVSRIAPLIPEHGRYVEPFLGGGAVFFSLTGENPSIISDVNHKLIHVYRMVRDSAEDLMRCIDEFAEDQSEEAYYRVRKDFNESENTLEQADRFIYLNKLCFNGLYRENRSRAFNSPYGKRNLPKMYDRDTLLKDSHKLRNADIRCASVFEVLESVQEGDFVYLDPPYDPIKEGSFTAYHGSGFGKREQEMLAYAVKEHAGKAKFMISNHDTPFVRSLYEGFQIIPVSVRRSISRDVEGRHPVGEVLILGGYHA